MEGRCGPRRAKDMKIDMIFISAFVMNFANHAKIFYP